MSVTAHFTCAKYVVLRIFSNLSCLSTTKFISDNSINVWELHRCWMDTFAFGFRVKTFTVRVLSNYTLMIGSIFLLEFWVLGAKHCIGTKTWFIRYNRDWCIHFKKKKKKKTNKKKKQKIGVPNPMIGELWGHCNGLNLSSSMNISEIIIQVLT